MLTVCPETLTTIRELVEILAEKGTRSESEIIKLKVLTARREAVLRRVSIPFGSRCVHVPLPVVLLSFQSQFIHSYTFLLRLAEGKVRQQGGSSCVIAVESFDILYV